jgi:hypothetical protein
VLLKLATLLIWKLCELCSPCISIARLTSAATRSARVLLAQSATACWRVGDGCSFPHEMSTVEAADCFKSLSTEPGSVCSPHML